MEKLDSLFEDLISESEFSEDLGNLFSDFDDEKIKIKKVIDEMKPIEYGFVSKKDGARITDRNFIHNCPNLSEYYEVQTNPEITLKEKLGICIDQSIAAKYLFEKYYPDIPCELYALTTGRFGHCVPCFNDNGNYYYLENAWDKNKGLWGPMKSEEELKKYLENTYHKFHDNDTGFAPVKVRTYSEYLREAINSLNESITFFE